MEQELKDLIQLRAAKNIKAAGYKSSEECKSCADGFISIHNEAMRASHAVGFRDGVIEGRKGYVKLADVLEFIEKRRNACRLDTEQFECRLCLSELLEALKSRFQESNLGGEMDRAELRGRVDAALTDLISQYELVRQSSESKVLTATVRQNCLSDILNSLTQIVKLRRLTKEIALLIQEESGEISYLYSQEEAGKALVIIENQVVPKILSLVKQDLEKQGIKVEVIE